MRALGYDVYDFLLLSSRREKIMKKKKVGRDNEILSTRFVCVRFVRLPPPAVENTRVAVTRTRESN